MARARNLPAEFWQSETVAAWPLVARLGFIALTSYLDNYGRGLDNSRVIASFCFPYDDDVDGKTYEAWISLYAESETICRYEHGGKHWLHAPKWTEWQRLSHPGLVRVPPCPVHEPAALAAFDGSKGAVPASSSGKSPEDFVPERKGKGEGKGGGNEEEGGVRPRTPAPDPLPDIFAHPTRPNCPKHRGIEYPPPCGDCKKINSAAKNGHQQPVPVPAVRRFFCDHRVPGWDCEICSKTAEFGKE
jgi:hypothetical protein